MSEIYGMPPEPEHELDGEQIWEWRMREAFERAAKERFHIPADLLVWSHELWGYEHKETQCYWTVWLSAIASVEIELPSEEPGYMYYAPDMVAAIEAAGLRVKP